MEITTQVTRRSGALATIHDAETAVSSSARHSRRKPSVESSSSAAQRREHFAQARAGHALSVTEQTLVEFGISFEQQRGEDRLGSQSPGAARASRALRRRGGQLPRDRRRSHADTVATRRTRRAHRRRPVQTTRAHAAHAVASRALQGPACAGCAGALPPVPWLPASSSGSAHGETPLGLRRSRLALRMAHARCHVPHLATLPSGHRPLVQTLDTSSHSIAGGARAVHRATCLETRWRTSAPDAERAGFPASLPAGRICVLRRKPPCPGRQVGRGRSLVRDAGETIANDGKTCQPGGRAVGRAMPRGAAGRAAAQPKIRVSTRWVGTNTQTTKPTNSNAM